MERDELIQKFFELCENSSFPHQEELLRGIRNGEYKLEYLSDSQVLAEELAGTYKIKVKSAERHNGKHARRLVSDTLNFIDELEKVPKDKVNFWHFSTNDTLDFTVFEGINSRRILGCLLTVAKWKVSKEEWGKTLG